MERPKTRAGNFDSSSNHPCLYRTESRRRDAIRGTVFMHPHMMRWQLKLHSGYHINNFNENFPVRTIPPLIVGKRKAFLAPDNGSKRCIYTTLTRLEIPIGMVSFVLPGDPLSVSSGHYPLPAAAIGWPFELPTFKAEFPDRKTYLTLESHIHTARALSETHGFTSLFSSRIQLKQEKSWDHQNTRNLNTRVRATASLTNNEGLWMRQGEGFAFFRKSRGKILSSVASRFVIQAPFGWIFLILAPSGGRKITLLSQGLLYISCCYDLIIFENAVI